MNCRKLLISIISSIVAIFFLLINYQPVIKAQSPNLKIMLTWQSLSYVPPNFEGKILPTAGSPIVASVEVIDLESGEIVNLSGQEIRWYINNNLIKSNSGKQRIFFRAPNFSPTTISLRVQIPSLGASMIEFIKIPVVSPEVVVEFPSYNNQFSTSSIRLTSNLYFWDEVDISQLNYSWKVNGESIQNDDSPQFLDLKIRPDTPSGYPISVELTVGHLLDQTKFFKQSIGLVFIKK